jgi:squalene cyclase
MNHSISNNTAAIHTAVERGNKYLLSLQSNGHWKGFPTLAGLSDVWVTGFVTTHLRQLSTQQDWLLQAQQFLLKAQHATGGWSYSTLVPPDADSTSWCRMALAGNKDFNALLQKQSEAFLWSHYANNGFSTYRADSGILSFIGANDPQLIAGWTAPHADVTAAAFLSDPHHPNATAVIEQLLQLQTTEGLLPAYWWRSKFYTLVLLLRSLHLSGKEYSSANQQLLKHTLANRQLKDGGFSLDGSDTYNSFATALALELYSSLTDVDAEANRCMTILLQHQKEDGSWQGDNLLRIPAPFIFDPETITEWSQTNGGGNSFIFDEQGLFTTAIACYALNRWLQVIG